MSIRVRSAQTKVISVVIAYVVGLAFSAAVAVAFGLPTGAVIAIILLIAAVVFFTRTFRGPTEDVDHPRAWWRMTERPLAGIIVSLLFAAQVAYLAATSTEWSNSTLTWVAAAVGAVVSLAFLGSSIRLHRNALPDE